MPLQSKEVVTLRLILDCDDGKEFDPFVHNSSQHRKQPVGLLDLPSEVRLEILRYLLLFRPNRTSHTRHLASGSIEHLLRIDSRRILEAPQFKHKSSQEINGILPRYHTCSISIAPLFTCKTIYQEGRDVLYNENSLVALQCGIRGMGGRLKNYGIPAYGPFEPQRLVTNNKKPIPKEPESSYKKFNPAVVIQGKSSAGRAPFYIVARDDGYDLLLALWIMVKSRFAKEMRFNILVTGDKHWYRSRLADALVTSGAIPWLHDYIESVQINVERPDEVAKDRLASITKLMVNSAPLRSNILSYSMICGTLDSLLHHAELLVNRQSYHAAEAHYERVCYAACSVVRTRTAKLVDVSAKMPDGINRICKLIAISAFRLCELRSGAISTFRHLRRSQTNNAGEEAPQTRNPSLDLSDDGQMQQLEAKISSKTTKTKRTTDSAKKVTSRRLAEVQLEASLMVSTTRLEHTEATEHAIVSGLLALRLPCACPVTEWNIRTSEMLIVLFGNRKDDESALHCVKRLQQNYGVILKEARAKGKKHRADYVEALLRDIHDCIAQDSLKTSLERARTYMEVLGHSHEVTRKLWGERLVPKPGYTGLIWTFRWA